MRAITVRQPWATAIVSLGKDVENRTRNIAGDYRGLLAIHSSQREEPTDHWSRQTIRDLTGYLPLFSLAAGRGAVLGVVDLIDVHPDTACLEGAPWPTRPTKWCSPWAMADHHHLVLANPRRLAEPISTPGRLGLWRVDDALAAQIRAQLPEVG